MKTTLLILLAAVTQSFAATYNSGPPLMAYPQPPAFPTPTNNAQLKVISATLLAAKCPKCWNTQPRIEGINPNGKGGFKFEFKCTKCKASPKWSTNTVAVSTVNLPPLRASMPPAFPNVEASATKPIVKQLPSIGYSHRTKLTNGSLPLMRASIIPASVTPLVLASHGPSYVQVRFIPQEAIFAACDYNLRAGHTYQFQVTENFIQWFDVVEPYFAPDDEVYTRSLNLSIGGYYFHYQFARMLEQ